jgi:hypothetical protein
LAHFPRIYLSSSEIATLDVAEEVRVNIELVSDAAVGARMRAEWVGRFIRGRGGRGLGTHPA